MARRERAQGSDQKGEQRGRGGGSPRTQRRRRGGLEGSEGDAIDDERRRPESGKEDDGDGFRANPADSLRGEGDLMMAELLDMALSCGEADGRVGEELCAGRRWRRRGCVRACVFLSA